MFASYAGLLSASTFSRSRIAHQVAEDDRVVAGILAASLDPCRLARSPHRRAGVGELAPFVDRGNPTARSRTAVGYQRRRSRASRSIARRCRFSPGVMLSHLLNGLGSGCYQRSGPITYVKYQSS